VAAVAGVNAQAVNSRCLILALAILTLAGCAASGQQKSDYAAVRRAGVPASLYDKMVQGRDLGIADVITLSRARVGDDVIVRYIRDQHTIYRLTGAGIARLQHGGVSQPVIDFMIHTDYRGPDTPWGP
jgi:hypothetical protein